MKNPGLDKDSLQTLIDTLTSFGKQKLPLKVRLDLDEKDIFPLDLIRELLGPDIGLHLLFIPEELGGLGGNAYDVYRVSEEMAKLTSVATHHDGVGSRKMARKAVRRPGQLGHLLRDSVDVVGVAAQAAQLLGDEQEVQADVRPQQLADQIQRKDVLLIKVQPDLERELLLSERCQGVDQGFGASLCRDLGSSSGVCLPRAE